MSWAFTLCEDSNAVDRYREQSEWQAQGIWQGCWQFTAQLSESPLTPETKLESKEGALSLKPLQLEFTKGACCNESM